MITKEYIKKTLSGSKNELSKLIKNQRDTSTLHFILDNLGRLPSDFDGDCFVELTRHHNDKIRLLAVKNIGKLSNDKYLSLLDKISANDDNTMVRREAISSIGRMRSVKAIPILLKKTSDPDPKVILQVIRALLVFKNNTQVREELEKLKNHPNEIISSVIEKELSTFRKSKSLEPKHIESPELLKNLAVKGDVLSILKYVQDDSIHLTFTSPPYYNARDYSIYQSYKEYLDFLNVVFKEVLRITKEGRFFILNTSPIIIPRVSRQHSSRRYPIPFDIHPYLIKMGWEFIDDIIWVKPEASAKNRNAGFLQHRKPLGYKPNAVTEYIMVYRKKTHKLLDWNIRQYDCKTVKESKVTGKYESSNVWYIDPTFDKTHTAVFPLELCNRIIQYYSYKGDLVFDPFGGSGTFGKSAVNLGRYFFVTEISDKYFDLIKDNLSQKTLFFSEKEPRFINLDGFKNMLNIKY